MLGHHSTARRALSGGLATQQTCLAAACFAIARRALVGLSISGALSQSGLTLKFRQPLIMLAYHHSYNVAILFITPLRAKSKMIQNNPWSWGSRRGEVGDPRPLERHTIFSGTENVQAISPEVTYHNPVECQNALWWSCSAKLLHSQYLA